MTRIEWTDETWNPVVGCSILSPGCTNCYAMTMAARIIAMAGTSRAGLHYDRTIKDVKGKPVWTGILNRAPEAKLLAPLRWRKPRRVFVNSMGDLFHESIPDEWIDQVFAVMALCPQHTFQVLTKRAVRMSEYCSDGATAYRVARKCIDQLSTAPKSLKVDDNWPVESIGDDIDFPDDITIRKWPLLNVWLGVSAERQQEADERIPLLLDTPAAVRFVSLEPLLGPIDLTRIRVPLDKGRPENRLDWVIVGGESGPNARPMHPDWARSLRDQCQAARAPFLFKQWGGWKPIDQFQRPGGVGGHAVVSADGRYVEAAAVADPPDKVFTFRVGKKAAGRLLDGRTWDEFPEVCT